MAQKIYQVDAFTNQVFAGNPAAICPLNEWLSDDILQKIALENNLSETAFYVKNENHFEIRWFTPTVEVDLCGHATLAAAFVLFNYGEYHENTINFYSKRSGNLMVSKNNDFLTLNFPTDTIKPIIVDEEIKMAFDIQPSLTFRGKDDIMLVFNSEDEILNLKPNLDKIATLACRGIIATALGNEVDFVSRFFAPQCGIDEDPVTGSAHTTLIPYWAIRLDKNELNAIQLSARKGFLNCKLLGNRVEISGQAKLYMKGEIFLD